MATRLPLEFSFAGAGASRTPREPDAPLRLLLVADLGGDRAQPLAARRAVAVDIDRFDAVMATVSPRVMLDLDGQALPLRLRTLDDFHPDALFDQVSAFAALRSLRDDARDARQLGRVAAALGLSNAAPVAAPSAAPSAAPAATTDAGDDIARLLGRPASAPVPAAPTAAGLLDTWLRGLVAPHVQADHAAEQQAVVAAIDSALGALMRRVLHAPALQAVEAAWRAVDRLVRGLDLGETAQLWLLDASRDELLLDLQTNQADLSGSVLHTQLQRRGADDTGYGLLAVDHAFGPAAADVQALAALGALGARAGVPVLANGTPGLVGAADAAGLTEPRRWLTEDDPALAAWEALRTAPMAPWLGLVLPRVLMRLPYGPATDPVSRFAFDELAAGRADERYLWGGGAPALALLAGQAFQAAGWDWDLAQHLDLDDLPSHVVRVDGEAQQQPTAEVLMGETAARALADRGLMPLASYAHRPAARLLGWQSVARPATALRGLGG